MINEKENAVLLIAGFTQREISTHKRKFYNLFRIEPWLVPMKRHGEWEGLTNEEIVSINDQHYNIAFRDFDADVAIARAIEDKLKEKNT